MPKGPFFPDDLQRMAKLLSSLYDGSGYLILKMVKKKAMRPMQIETELHDKFRKPICPSYTGKSISRLIEVNLLKQNNRHVKLTPLGREILSWLEKIEASLEGQNIYEHGEGRSPQVPQ